MRTPRLVLLGAVAGMAVAGCQSSPSATPSDASSAPARSDVVRINDDVSCDKAVRRCSFRGVPSVGLTRLIFGNAPAEDIAVSSAHPEWKSDPIFQPSVGITCDTLAAACYDQQGPSVDLTRATFGGNAATRLDKRMRQPAKGREIVKYGSAVTCDRDARVCYDRLGASVGYTRLYLGREPSEVLLDRMRPHRD